MTRGQFADLAANSAYSNSAKDWVILLEQSKCYWYDLIVNPPEFAETKDWISGQLRQLRQQVEQSVERRFIYFFASRPKVRFDAQRAPRYTRFTKELELDLLTGRDGERVRIKQPVFDMSGRRITPPVEISERFIRLFEDDQHSETYSIHDFLETFHIGIGALTTIHYVGITKSPADRLLSREHRGITDTLYSVSNEDNDFFIFINLFKVLSKTANRNSHIAFVLANSLIDEVQTDLEGAIIEGALINYFDCPCQEINRTKDRSSFMTRLQSLGRDSKIRSVGIHLEVEPPSEYFVFRSESVAAARSHTFVYELVDGELRLRRLSSERELFPAEDLHGA